MTSILKVDTIKKTDNSTFPIGKILQVKQTIMSGNGVSTTAAYPIEVSGFTVSITPSSTSSKILATLLC